MKREHRLPGGPQEVTAAFHDFVLDASEEELDEALFAEGEDPANLLAHGKAVLIGALAEASMPTNREPIVNDDDDVLHLGLSNLIQLLRRRDRISEEELAKGARVEVEEVRRLEFDSTYTPSPRTIYQLEEYFRLPPRTLVYLSGAVSRQPAELKDEVLRFAANSKAVGRLSRDEKRLLNEFVRFLAKHAARATDK